MRRRDGVARARNGPERDADLGLAARIRQLLDGLPVAVAARKVHAAVHAGGVALEHMLHEAHTLEVPAPVVRRAEPQTRDRVRDRHLKGRLALVLHPDGVLDGRSIRREPLVDPGAERERLRPVVAHPLEHVDDEGGVQQARKRW